MWHYLLTNTEAQLFTVTIYIDILLTVKQAQSSYEQLPNVPGYIKFLDRPQVLFVPYNCGVFRVNMEYNNLGLLAWASN